MSNKLLLLLILGVVFFSACSDDDKDPNYDGTYKDSGLELSKLRVFPLSVMVNVNLLPSHRTMTSFPFTR